jgi:hypothetical protein
VTDYPNSTDATEWAKAFIARTRMRSLPVTDVHEWFAHAIEAGREVGWVQAGMAESIRRGLVESDGIGDDGEPTYRMTAAGRAYVENDLGVKPNEQRR